MASENIIDNCPSPMDVDSDTELNNNDTVVNQTHPHTRVYGSLNDTLRPVESISEDDSKQLMKLQKEQLQNIYEIQYGEKAPKEWNKVIIIQHLKEE